MRKQFRSWRKQVSPAPYLAATDATARRQELPEDAGGRDPTPSKPAAATTMGQLKIGIGDNDVEGNDALGQGKAVGEQSRGERLVKLVAPIPFVWQTCAFDVYGRKCRLKRQKVVLCMCVFVCLGFGSLGKTACRPRMALPWAFHDDEHACTRLFSLLFGSNTTLTSSPLPYVCRLIPTLPLG